MDAPDADADLSADFHQFSAEAAAGGAGEPCLRQREPPQDGQQDIGQRGKPQPELIGAHVGKALRRLAAALRLLLKAPLLASTFSPAAPDCQQMITTEDIERQIAVAVIVAVEEAPFLLIVDRIIRRIQIEYNLSGRLALAVQEQLDKEPLDGLRIMGNAPVAIRAARRMLQAVQGRLA